MAKEIVGYVKLQIKRTSESSSSVGPIRAKRDKYNGIL